MAIQNPPNHQMSMPVTQPRYVGHDTPRIEDPLLLTGRAEYGDNIKVHGALHMAILRSPHARARILRVDASKAEQLPGVVAVLTPEDVAKWSRPIFGIPEGWTGRCTATEITHWAGEPVCAVAATDRYIAEDALDLIEVDYEPLEPVVDPLKAIEGGEPILEGKDSNVPFARTFTFGEVQEAFAQADIVVKERFRWHRSSGNPIETCVCLAEWDSFTNNLTLRGSHRSPHLVLPGVVAALGLSPNNIRIYTSPLGGSFGTKTFVRYVILTALMSKKAGGRPVKWTEDRIEHLVGNATHAWDRYQDCELALKSDGTFLGLRMKVVDDWGASTEWLSTGQLVKPIISYCSTYKIPAFEYDATGVLTNKLAQGPYRGFGLPSHYWMLDQLVDIAAERVGLDRAEIRRRNFIRKEEFPYTIASGNIYDSGDYEGSLDLLLEKGGYAELLKEQEQARAEGRLVGVSVVTSIEPGLTNTPMLALLSPAIFMRSASPEGIQIRLDAFGKMIAGVGFPMGGQSQYSFVRQVLADYFGLPPEDISVVPMDSQTMPPGTGPISSRMAVALSGAVMGAANQLAEKLRRAAAGMLEANFEDVELLDGHLRVRGVPDKALPVVRVAQFMLGFPERLPEGMDGNPSVTYVWNPPEPGLIDEQGKARYSVTASGAVHMCMVEVDRGTGQVQVLKYCMVDDCGVRLNPSVVRGQIQGGVAHGIGNALLEEYVFDEQGQNVTSTFMDYLLPSIHDVPMTEEFPISTPSPFTELGVKGIGEAAIHTTPAAVLCAINDALKPLGVRITEAPATPLRIWQAINQGEH
ncbi:MAG TPA: xanthine dehydrogenase family protein molybdopterin-binding subunit [Chloroflexota bacterium]|nr:xanthine dehydrogenase family protein molybdopterin-binding subunit [Chloroflexota bacterium]